MTFESRHYLLAGLGLIAAINLIALGGVWYNRTGEADSQLLLSERELSVIHSSGPGQNSGRRLQLNWERPQVDEPGMPGGADLSPAQMQQLGYRASEACQSRCPRQASLPVLLVLELDGALYHQHLERYRQRLIEAEQALARLPDEASLGHRVKDAKRRLRQVEHGSRLYLADVGQERESLRQRYPDRERYAIVAGTLRPYTSQYGLSGSVSPLIHSINLPHPWRAVVDAAGAGKARYRIALAFGQRLEPWITDASATAP